MSKDTKAKNEPKEDKFRLCINVKNTTRQRLKVFAAQSGKEMQDIAEAAILAYLDKHAK